VVRHDHRTCSILSRPRSRTLEPSQSLNVDVSVAATAALQIVPQAGGGLLVALGLALALQVSRRPGLRLR
jgi:hypothetical protein